MQPYTAEQISQMTIEEINSNWEDVKTSLRILYEQRSNEKDPFEKGFNEERS